MARGKSNAGYDEIVNRAMGLPKIAKPKARPIAPTPKPAMPKTGGTLAAKKPKGWFSPTEQVDPNVPQDMGIGDFMRKQMRNPRRLQ